LAADVEAEALAELELDAVLAAVWLEDDEEALAEVAELAAVFLLQPAKQTASIRTARSRQRTLLNFFMIFLLDNFIKLTRCAQITP
jgi:hypothetical protein